MNKRIAILLRKFLTGKSNLAEQTELDNWYNQDSSKAVDDAGKQQWVEVRYRMWQHIETKIKPERMWKAWFRPGIAAAVLIAIGLSVWFLKPGGYKSGNMQYPVSNTVISTGKGEIKQLTFPDGTQAWLNVLSSVSYSNEYGKKERNIKLSGEAFFDVVHDATKPFVVYTQYSVTHVLGTSFSVRAYPGEKQRIGVASGNVRVSIPVVSGRSEYNLIHGEKVSLDPVTNSVELGHTDPTRLMCWKDNILHFDSQPLSEVTATIRRKFGVQVYFKDTALAGRQFTGTFEKAELSGILRSIGLSMGLTIKHLNDTTVEILK